MSLLQSVTTHRTSSASEVRAEAGAAAGNLGRTEYVGISGCRAMRSRGAITLTKGLSKDIAGWNNEVIIASRGRLGQRKRSLRVKSPFGAAIPALAGRPPVLQRETKVKIPQISATSSTQGLVPPPS